VGRETIQGDEMRPEPAKFTKDNPCTKKHIWNCFAGPQGLRPVSVVAAQAQIGVYVPRVMERNARLVCKTVKGTDYYELTPEGEEWLTAGIRSYLKNHPSEAGEVTYPPDTLPARVRRVRR